MDVKRSPSSIGSAAHGSSSVRKERGAIAAQACELCRTRKQRCDEARPKCGTCKRLNAECFYREPQPTKKDNTLQDILRRLTNIERFMEEMSRSGCFKQSQNLMLRPLQDLTSDVEGYLGSSAALGGSCSQASVDSRTKEDGLFNTPSTRSMLNWPVMKHLPDNTGTKDKGTEEKTPPFMTEPAAAIDGGQQPLSKEGIASTSYPTGSSTPASFHYPSPTVIQPTLTSVVGWETVQPLSKGYFDTFNQLHPIVDETWFMNNTIGHIMNTVGNTPASALAFLVLALGEVALAGNAVPISSTGGRASGIRGGTLSKPPGLEFFNEARHRMGLFATEVSVENLQVKCLSALYFASSGRPGDCWREAASATIICQSLVTRVHEPHASEEVIRRLFFHCFEVTFVLGAELQLPITDLDYLCSYVGLPEFAGGQSEEEYLDNQTSQFSDYAQSQIFMHRLFSRLYSTWGGSASPKTSATPETARDKIRLVSKQLERWRELLPHHLSWEDGHFLGFTSDDPSPQFLIAHNLMDDNMAYPYVSMMQIALVRSQYSLARHMIFRYYIYKALHHPDSLQPEDYRGAAECLKAALKWPITMAPPSMNKRLVPLPFYWSQNVCGALVLLNLAQNHIVLSHIRTTFCGQDFDYEASETIDLYIQWLRDMKQICPASERCWNIIRPLYNLRD